MRRDPVLKSLVGLLFVLPALTGCGCDAVAFAGISVRVVDAATSTPIVRGDVRIIARDGAYADTSSIAPAGLAIERAGMYTVTVEVPGYARFEQTAVRVLQGDCNVRTATVIAPLRRAP